MLDKVFTLINQQPIQLKLVFTAIFFIFGVAFLFLAFGALLGLMASIKSNSIKVCVGIYNYSFSLVATSLGIAFGLFYSISSKMKSSSIRFYSRKRTPPRIIGLKIEGDQKD
jgi:hypothetical protein